MTIYDQRSILQGIDWNDKKVLGKVVNFELDLSNYKLSNIFAARSRPVVKLGYKLHTQSVGLRSPSNALEGSRHTCSTVSYSSLGELNKYRCKIKSHIAYFRVHSRAVASYLGLSVLY